MPRARDPGTVPDAVGPRIGLTNDQMENERKRAHIPQGRHEACRGKRDSGIGNPPRRAHGAGYDEKGDDVEYRQSGDWLQAGRGGTTVGTANQGGGAVPDAGSKDEQPYRNRARMAAVTIHDGDRSSDRQRKALGYNDLLHDATNGCRRARVRPPRGLVLGRRLV